MIKSIIKYIKKKTTLKNGEFVISDMGCGDAKIAQYFDNKDKNKRFRHYNLKISVKSFDLIKINDYITNACDMSSVPLSDASVDCCVFCLSLMGTNWIDYLIEANRILLPNSILKIIEVKSRFVSFHKFERCLFHCGFDFISKNDSFGQNNNGKNKNKNKNKNNRNNNHHHNNNSNSNSNNSNNNSSGNREETLENNSHFVLYNFKKSSMRGPTSSVVNFTHGKQFSILKPCTYKRR